MKNSTRSAANVQDDDEGEDSAEELKNDQNRKYNIKSLADEFQSCQQSRQKFSIKAR